MLRRQIHLPQERAIARVTLEIPEQRIALHPHCFALPIGAVEPGLTFTFATATDWGFCTSGGVTIQLSSAADGARVNAGEMAVLAQGSGTGSSAVAGTAQIVGFRAQ